MQDKIRRLIALDRTLIYAIAARVWQSLSGPITLVLLLSTLDEQAQGIYYGLAHLVGLQAMFDLGLTNVLVTQFGHAWGKSGSQTTEASPLTDLSLVAELRKQPGEAQKELSFVAELRKQPGDAHHDSAVDPAARAARLQSDGEQRNDQTSGEARSVTDGMRHLLRGAELWYGLLAVVCGTAVFGMGVRLLILNQTGSRPMIPLALFVLTSFATFALSPRLAALEGVGFRESVYRSRFWQMVAGSFGVWGALVWGGGVWALTVAAAVQCVMSFYLVFVEQGSFFRSIRSSWSWNDVAFWFRRVLPLQWRSGILAIAHYLSSQVFVLVLLTFGRSVEAGRMGATLSIVAAIQALALAWVQTKLPVVASHHGEGDRETAGELWRRTAVLSTSLLVGGLAFFVMTLVSFRALALGWETRFVPAELIAVMSLGLLANHLVSLQNFYVLARGSLPLFAVAFLGCSATAVAVWFGGFAYGLTGVTVGYALGTALVLLPLHSLAYRRYRVST